MNPKREGDMDTSEVQAMQAEAEWVDGEDGTVSIELVSSAKVALGSRHILTLDSERNRYILEGALLPQPRESSGGNALMLASVVTTYTPYTLFRGISLRCRPALNLMVEPELTDAAREAQREAREIKRLEQRLASLRGR